MEERHKSAELYFSNLYTCLFSCHRFFQEHYNYLSQGITLKEIRPKNISKLHWTVLVSMKNVIQSKSVGQFDIRKIN